jgi:hypothetical protein
VAYPSNPIGRVADGGVNLPSGGPLEEEKGVVMDERVYIPSGGPPEGMGSWGE